MRKLQLERYRAAMEKLGAADEAARVAAREARRSVREAKEAAAATPEAQERERIRAEVNLCRSGPVARHVQGARAWVDPCESYQAEEFTTAGGAPMVCWIWSRDGARAGENPDREPTLRPTPRARLISARRYVCERTMLKQGRASELTPAGDLPETITVVMVCGHARCIRPDHMMLMLRSTLQRESVQRVRARMGRDLGPRGARVWTPRDGILEPEQVAEIRASVARHGERCALDRELAARFGISASAVRTCRIGETYRAVSDAPGQNATRESVRV